jgi:16S rRNA (cytosine967-C5)-methyltransferase
MRPAARVQAAIELLDQIIDAAKSGGAPADRLIAEYFRQRRYAGSKDRRAVRELVYSAIRICGEIPKSGRAAMLALGQQAAAILELFDGSMHGPLKISVDEAAAVAGIAPQWLVDALAKSGVEGEVLAALMDRAPLDIRVNTLKSDRQSLELPENAEALVASQALRLPAGLNVEQWDAYRNGLIEVQDHGSQVCCSAFDARPGETIIDLCAGAGGKSLTIAAQMEGRGRLLACDIDRTRLSKLEPRAMRAGASTIETILLDPNREIEGLAEFVGKADKVLVDAPCSGTGTWRRKPESKWRLTPKRLAQFSDTQDKLLDIAARLVRPGGEVFFVTCSLLDEEGKNRIDAFLARSNGWKAAELSPPIGRKHGEGWRLTPYHDGTDGFFLAKLVSAC